MLPVTSKMDQFMVMASKRSPSDNFGVFGTSKSFGIQLFLPLTYYYTFTTFFYIYIAMGSSIGISLPSKDLTG